jgi:hypothetical protein
VNESTWPIQHPTRDFHQAWNSGKARVDPLARLGVYGASLDLKYIDHILNSEHERALLRLPRAVAPMVIFP